MARSLSAPKPATISDARIVGLIGALRLDLGDEKRTQAEIAAALAAAGIAAAREVRLGPGAIVDFLTADGVAIEVKLHRARPADIRRQLDRYARHDRVAALVLLTNRALALPRAVAGKPVWSVSLGKAWL